MTRVHIIGTGVTALTIAHRLVISNHHPSISIHLFDKARAPGGRLTSRRVRGSDITLEPGARVFQSRTEKFERQCERWVDEGYIKEVKGDKIKGVGNDKNERWWEASQGGGWTGNLIDGLIKSIQDKVTIHYNTTLQSIQRMNGGYKFEPPISNLDRPDIFIFTTPSPQTSALIPNISTPLKYRATFALMFPYITIPSTVNLPTYWRDPIPGCISSISTGVKDDGTVTGLVVQASPEGLGLNYDKEISKDTDVYSAMISKIDSSGLLGGIKLKDESEWQLKRWKFAQVEHPPEGQDEVRVIDDVEGGGMVIIAGDGESRIGGVEGAWISAGVAVDKIEQYIAAIETA